VKSAPAGQQQPVRFGRVGDCAAIKAYGFVPHGNQNFPIHTATAGEIDPFLGILMIAVNHGVCEGLVYRDFNLTSVLLAPSDSPMKNIVNRMS
jgi:hypothetical protein